MLSFGTYLLFQKLENITEIQQSLTKTIQNIQTSSC